MDLSLGRVTAVAALALIGALSLHAQTGDTENVKIVTTGEIKKIDDKNKTFQFKFNLDLPPFVNRGPVNQPPQGGGRPGGMGGRRRGGIGYPGGNRYPAPAAVENSKEVKVFTSDSTSLKDSNATLRFSDLKKGDHVTVTAIHKEHGDDIEALVIKRD
jgi:hypothetical protein